MAMYKAVMQMLIEKEIAGTSYISSPEDRAILDEMVEEINQKCGTNVYYLAELDNLRIPGAGEIVRKYFFRFSSEYIRGFVLFHMVEDNIEDCAEILYQGFLSFMNSDEYISPPGKPSPACIEVAYDNAFRRLRPRKLKQQLTELVLLPRNAFSLAFTTNILASWKVPALKDALIRYALGNAVTPSEVGLDNPDLEWYPPFDWIVYQLRFRGIRGLRYYRTPEIEDFIRNMPKTDRNIAAAIDQTIKFWDKQDAR